MNQQEIEDRRKLYKLILDSSFYERYENKGKYRKCLVRYNLTYIPADYNEEEKKIEIFKNELFPDNYETNYDNGKELINEIGFVDTQRQSITELSYDNVKKYLEWITRKDDIDIQTFVEDPCEGTITTENNYGFNKYCYFFNNEKELVRIYSLDD